MKSLSVLYSKKLFPSRALIYLILIFTLLNCNSAYPTNLESRDEKLSEGNAAFGKFKKDHSVFEIYSMYIIILIILQIGSLSTLYVILRTFIRWKRVDFSLNMTHKLPFYMALSDLIIYVALTVNLAWSHFGSDQYWCYSSRTSSFIPLTLLYVDIATLTISIFCYIAISYAINVVRSRNDNNNHANNENNLFLPAYKKIVGYLFIYILQWTPVMVYVLIDTQQQTSMWVYVVCFSSLSIGGVLNAARYISNEGWWLKKENPEIASSTFRTDQMASNTVTTKSGQTETVSSQWNLPEDETNISSSLVEKSNKSSMETGTAN
ncbi:9979_t:CDS:2 [Rhizophagus irregularis]|nr:9979_t:CDS:2 [Rhizophagus irregularis]